jgi:hypothetical protein
MADVTAWNPAYVALAATFAVVAIVQWRHRRASARAAVERWAQRHRYRLRRVSNSWGGAGASSAGELWREKEGDVVFRAEVEDTAMGGTGAAYVRCRADWLGRLEREVDPERDVRWITMPDPYGGRG